jgi:hypothetical protein
MPEFDFESIENLEPGTTPETVRESSEVLGLEALVPARHCVFDGTPELIFFRSGRR